MTRIGLMAVLGLLVGTLGQAAAQNTTHDDKQESKIDDKQISYNGVFSGSVLSTEIDTNSDGLRAVSFTIVGKTNLGRTDVHTILEFAPAGPGVCPNGNQGLLLTAIFGTGTIRFERREGDMLFVRADPGLKACADPSTGQQFVSGVLDFIGGTGGFDQAGGSIEVSSVTQGLFQDPKGRLFGASSGQFEGTIVRF